MVTPSASAKLPAKANERLILQDPLGWDQGSRPNLRSSYEMPSLSGLTEGTSATQPVSALDRDTARTMWEQLQRDPAQSATQAQAAAKRLLQLQAQEKIKAQEIAQLQAKLQETEQQRLHHPAVYAGAAGLALLGGMWWLERRKRQVLQDGQMEHWSQGQAAHRSPSASATREIQALDAMSRPEPLETTKPAITHPVTAPASAAPLVLPESDMSVSPVTSPAPSQFQSELQAVAWATPKYETPQQGEQQSLLSLSKRVLGNMLRRKSAQNEDSASSAVEESNFDSFVPSQSDTQIPLDSLPPDSTPLPLRQADAESLGTRRPTREDFLEFMDDEEANEWLDDQAHEAFEREMSEKMRLLDRPKTQNVSPLAQAPAIALTAPSLASSSKPALRSVEPVLTSIPVQQKRQVEDAPDLANIQLLARTPVASLRGEDAMDHLLEVRTAVMGLTVLSRPLEALRLLEEFVTAEPETCAWAYIEYMHLCEQVGEREKFEAMRSRYRIQFSRLAPYWKEPNAHVLGLDGYARATTEMCGAWGKGEARSIISTWLLGHATSRKLLQLPAYHDLMDLYELLEFKETVDFQESANLLPLQDSGSVNGEKLSSANDAFVSTVSLLDLDYEFSVDVTFDEKAVQEAERAVSIALKPGNLSVDYNVTSTQHSALASVPATFPKN